MYLILNNKFKMADPKVPSELRLSQHWDVAVERLVINASIGLVVGGLASIVVFSKSFLSVYCCFNCY